MKKVMFAVAAIAAGAAIADVTSANVVGYQNITAEAQYVSVGRTFKNVGTDGKKTYLYDIVCEGMSDSGADFIQLLNGTAAATYFKATYCDDPDDPSEDGWYMPSDTWGTPAENKELPAGTAMLCNMPHCKPASPVIFKFAGEVENGRQVVATEQYAFIANSIPVDFKLYDITCVGMSDSGADFIQLLNNTQAATYFKATYCDDPDDPSEDGWYQPNDTWGTLAENVDIPAGQGFLCNMPHCKETAPVVFNFPDPMEK